MSKGDRPHADYDERRAAICWDIPQYYNIGVDVSDRWATREPGRIAIIEYDETSTRAYTFGELEALSNQLANELTALGIRRGDRIGVLAPQRIETAVAHIAIFKIGAIGVPLFSLFGHAALQHRLHDSGARLVIADAEGVSKLQGCAEELPALEAVLPIDPAPGGCGLLERIASQSVVFTPVATKAEDPAIIIYTSGTTGNSKGALHAHRVLLGHLPGVEMSHGGNLQPGDRMWTPADWAWIGGLFDVLLPALRHGTPVIACRFSKFDAAAAVRLMELCGVSATFLPPTALKMLRASWKPEWSSRLQLRSVASGGESLGPELLQWGREALGVEINEFYGQTECNMIVSSCANWFASRPGAIGKPVPGHEVAVLDPDGNQQTAGRAGEIAVLSPDPVMFLGYWGQPGETSAKFNGAWLKTGDLGMIDEDGFVHFLGRADDVITSAGYRIGPAEIEDCLLRHPAVSSAAVVGVADSLRTEIVTAFVVLRPDEHGDDELAEALKDQVRTQLGAHQYPRRVHFLAELPLTATGKIMRRELREMGRALQNQ